MTVDSFDDALLEILPARTQDGRARAEALRRTTGLGARQTTTVDFRSKGRVLIVGDPQAALAAVRTLEKLPACVVVIPRDAPPLPEDSAMPRVTVAKGDVRRLTGYLGHFTATVEVDGDEFNLASLMDPHATTFDLVLDLGTAPLMQQEIPPLGYYAPRGDADALQAALSELPELIGDFEKPKFFDYDPDICAHGRSGLTGCTRCIDACPTLAIRSLGDKVEVDPHLCQGGGSCATACPSGAIRYAYPAVSDLLTGVRTALHSYREFGGGKATVLFHDAGTGARAFRTVAASMPEWVLPFEIEEPGSIGMDTWLATLAYGARQVLVLVTGSAAPSVLRELSLQLSYASALLEGLGYAGRRIQLLCDGEGAGTALTRALAGLDDAAEIAPAGFASFDEKRTTLGLALDHLYAHAPVPQRIATLPDGAPFGEIRVDATACTLCMACVSVCPSKALHDGGDRPALRFVEGNCVQCGLCHTACPEDAISLAPRVVYDRAARGEMRVLHEEPVFRCVVCGKPFATQKIIDRMMEKLSSHWMFQDETARRRLQMCEDCRVMDMFEQGEPNVTDKPRAHGH